MHDESSEPRVLASLMRAAAVPPSRLTPQEAVRLGRRSVSRRRGLVVGAAAVAVLAVAGVVNLRFGDDRPPVVVPPSSVPSPEPSPSPERPPGWVATRLANPPNAAGYVQVEAVDPSGRFIVGNTGAGIVLWDNGTPTVLPVLEPDLLENQVADVNSSGVVIGTAGRHDGRYFGWVYRDGKYTKLAIQSGVRQYRANEINDRGDILGSSDRLQALLWPASAPGTVKVVHGVESVLALDNDGTMGSTVGDGDYPCVIAPDGKQRRLDGPPGNPRGKVFALRGDWAGGWVSNRDNSSNLMAARWNLRTGELTSYPELTRPVLAVSASGAVLSAKGGDSFTEHPIVVDPGGTRHLLEGSIPGDLDWNVDAVDMSADGTIIVGIERSRLEGGHAVMWRFAPRGG